ncbi:MAG: SDR family oxidoreductase [Candidatus Freyarchaeota archaeon]
MRLGRAEDVAPLAAFLASSDSDYMTCQSINIDSGVDFH